MATPTGSTRIARGNRFRVHALADGGWRIGFTTKLGYRDFPADPATDAAFGEFYRMTTADQIDAGRRPHGARTYDADPRAPRRLGITAAAGVAGMIRRTAIRLAGCRSKPYVSR